ncbi:hypothetical protein [Nocardia sp. NPDC005825]|uniref:hypothetical protein n=1 Tax=unclassified Nocardia TaxID=2637762 RepID=UPI00340E4232
MSADVLSGIAWTTGLIAFVGGPLLLMIVHGIKASNADRERKERLWQWARANGWQIQEHALVPWTDRLPGRRRQGLGVMVTGMIGGRWVTIAEYTYTDTETTQHYVVVRIMLDRPHPSVAVERRGLGSQFERALFGDKPTATGNVLFDSCYAITAPDRSAAKTLVGPPLIAAHIEGRLPSWSLLGNELLTYTTAGKFQHPNQILAYAGPLLRVADLLGPTDFSAPADR